MSEADRINRAIHEFLGKCWHEYEKVPTTLTTLEGEVLPSFWWRCVRDVKDCPQYGDMAILPLPQGPDYTTDLNAVREAELAVIEKFGIDAYGRALTKLAFSDGIISDDQHGAFLITAPAELRAKAVADVVENER